MESVNILWASKASLLTHQQGFKLKRGSRSLQPEAQRLAKVPRNVTSLGSRLRNHGAVEHLRETRRQREGIRVTALTPQPDEVYQVQVSVTQGEASLYWGLGIRVYRFLFFPLFGDLFFAAPADSCCTAGA